MKLPPATPLEEVSWVPANRRAALSRLGLSTLGDLIFHYPRRHEDRTRFDRLPDGDSPAAVCLCGTVLKTTLKRFGRRKSFEVQLAVQADSPFASHWVCRWFNAHYVQKIFAADDRVVVFGKTRKRGEQIYMDHPEFEILEEDGESSMHFGRITPVHPAGEGITTRLLRGLIHQALEATDLEALPSLLPDRTGSKSRAEALRQIHFPDDWETLAAARPRLALEEFFSIQAILVSRRESIRSLPGAAKKPAGYLAAELLEKLPFALTGDQKKVLGEIGEDLSSGEPMQRLLQGDVGSGKTIVALLAALQVIEAGWQAALMAPTQILATQHFETFRPLLEPLGVPVILRTGSRKEATNDLPLFQSTDYPPLIVGTHALLYESTEFEKLGLAIIDEQHKFGVMQRARLLARGSAPDLLVMTATPIPRTLTQTLHGDLDVSILREKPANRGKIITAVRAESKLPAITSFLREQLEEGRQAYIVYALIDESEKLEAKAATEEAAKWAKSLHPFTVEVLHGRLSSEEKDGAMERFRRQDCQVLVSTTVVEVGVDIPNATIMLVENAERFGLAQLHQLRGRVGRGLHKSYCILVHGNQSAGAKEKLTVLEESSDGFVIAEADLRLRGPGDLIGTAQTGLPPIRIGDLVRDGEIMTEARRLAFQIFSEDPRLEKPEHHRLRSFLRSQQKQREAAAG